MSTIHTVLYTEEYPLQLGKRGVFNLLSKKTKKQNPVESRRLPQRFVQDEIDRARLQDSWNTFSEGVDVLRGIKGNGPPLGVGWHGCAPILIARHKTLWWNSGTLNMVYTVPDITSSLCN